MRIAYYSDFWYSRFMGMQLRDMDGSYLRREVRTHLHRLRILSIFFDAIYIPRTHFLTQTYEKQWEVNNEVIQSNDFRHLLANNKILVSTFPMLDANQDAARIIERSTKTQQVTYAKDATYLRRLPREQGFVIKSDQEATSNTVTFDGYAKMLAAISTDLSKKLQELIKASTLDDIPFFHEHFVLSIKKQLSTEEFGTIWRNTNSIYLCTGAPNQSGVVPYYNEDLEFPTFRFEPNGLDRYLLAFDPLKSFLSIFISVEDMAFLLNGEIHHVMRYLSDSSRYSEALVRFKISFWAMVEEISLLIRDTPLSRDFALTTVIALWTNALDKNFAERASVVRGIAEDAAAIAKAAGAVAGAPGGMSAVGALLKPLTRYGPDALRDLLRQKRYPGLIEGATIIRKCCRDEKLI